MLGVADAELEVDLAGVPGHDVAHEASDLIPSVWLKVRGLVYVAFEVDTVSVDEYLVEWQLLEHYILTQPCTSGVHPESDVRPVVDHLGTNLGKNRSEGPGHLDGAPVSLETLECALLTGHLAEALQTCCVGN